MKLNIKTMKYYKKKLQSQAVHKMLEIQLLNICL